MRFILSLIRIAALFIVFHNLRPEASRLLIALALLVAMGTCYFEGLNKL